MDQAKSCSGANRDKLNLTYAYGHYVNGNGIYIEAQEDGELHADVTVNLMEYRLKTGPNEIFIPSYKYPKEFIDKVKHDLVKRVIMRINFGPYDAYADLAELKDDWKDICVPLESLYRPNNED